MFETLSAKDPPLTNGDKVQVHVHSARPQYLYVYWYDPAGQSRRLWPDSPESQHELTELALPPERDRWFTIDGSRGNEMVVVGAAQKPLDATALAALEKTPSFAAGSHTVTGPLLLPIAGTERGLGADGHLAQKSARQFASKTCCEPTSPPIAASSSRTSEGSLAPAPVVRRTSPGDGARDHTDRTGH